VKKTDKRDEEARKRERKIKRRKGRWNNSSRWVVCKRDLSEGKKTDVKERRKTRKA
jgi:hypothetical protein